MKFYKRTETSEEIIPESEINNLQFKNPGSLNTDINKSNLIASPDEARAGARARAELEPEQIWSWSWSKNSGRRISGLKRRMSKRMSRSWIQTYTYR